MLKQIDPRSARDFHTSATAEVHRGTLKARASSNHAMVGSQGCVYGNALCYCCLCCRLPVPNIYEGRCGCQALSVKPSKFRAPDCQKKKVASTTDERTCTCCPGPLSKARTHDLISYFEAAWRPRGGSLSSLHVFLNGLLFRLRIQPGSTMLSARGLARLAKVRTRTYHTT